MWSSDGFGVQGCACVKIRQKELCVIIYITTRGIIIWNKMVEYNKEGNEEGNKEVAWPTLHAAMETPSPFVRMRLACAERMVNV